MLRLTWKNVGSFMRVSTVKADSPKPCSKVKVEGEGVRCIFIYLFIYLFMYIFT